VISSIAMKTLAFGTVDEVLVLVLGERELADAEWTAYLDALEAHYHATGRARVLVRTSGGAPMASQRHLLDARLGKQLAASGRVAICSESRFARVIMSATSEMLHAHATSPAAGASLGGDRGQFYRMFSPQEMRSALAWLEVSSTRESDVVRKIHTLEAEIGRG